MSRSLPALKRKYNKRHKRPPSVPRSVVFPGATRNFSHRSLKIARFIEWKFDIVPHTYAWHGVEPDGSNGEAWAMGIHIAPDNLCANAAQENYGDLIQNFLEKANGDVPWRYLIWWGWMRYDLSGWFDYTPHWQEYATAHGNANRCDGRHFNHVHVQIHRPR
jgi:hypothetical protein